MTAVVEVQFKGNRREFYTWDDREALKVPSGFRSGIKIVRRATSST